MKIQSCLWFVVNHKGIDSKNVDNNTGPNFLYEYNMKEQRVISTLSTCRILLALDNCTLFGP